MSSEKKDFIRMADGMTLVGYIREWPKPDDPWFVLENAKDQKKMVINSRYVMAYGEALEDRVVEEITKPSLVTN